MAVVAMSVIAIAWHQTMQEQAPGCQALSFADNWEFTAPDPATIRLGADATTDFFALLKLTAAAGKAWTWAHGKRTGTKLAELSSVAACLRGCPMPGNWVPIFAMAHAQREERPWPIASIARLLRSTG